MSMTIDEARAVVNETIEGRKRWCQQFDAATIGVEKILDALVVLREHGEDGAEVTAANRRTGAAKGREAKWKGKMEHAQQELAQTRDRMEELEEQLKDANTAIRTMRGVMEATNG